MFRDIGKKIMLLAQIMAVAVPVGTVLCLVCSLSRGGRALPCLVAGVLLFASAWPVYGFGQLVQDIHDMRLSSKHINIQDEDLPHL